MGEIISGKHTYLFIYLLTLISVTGMVEGDKSSTYKIQSQKYGRRRGERLGCIGRDLNTHRINELCRPECDLRWLELISLFKEM